VPLHRRADGQATVELLALLPALAAVAALLWQAVLAGQAVWLAQVAAGRAARAATLAPPDPAAAARRAARSALPPRLARDVRVRLDGEVVHVRLGVPAAVGGRPVADVRAHARVVAR
jgi:hypothetical protein